MKYKSCIAMLVLLHTTCWAEGPYPHAGLTEEPPYILKIHGCDFKNLTAKHRFVPIERESSSSALIVPPSYYESITESVSREIKRSKDSNVELKKAWKKTAEFEEAGNIPAMEHWKGKAQSIELQITRNINARLLPEYAQKIISRENPPTYFGRLHTDHFKTKTLQELIEATGDNCAN